MYSLLTLWRERTAEWGSESTKSTIVDLFVDAEVVERGKVRNGESVASKKKEG
jgi:hypothetical protein